MSAELGTETSLNKKFWQHHQKTPKRQSIKLHIELPFVNETSSSFKNSKSKNFKIRKSSTFCNPPGYLIENENDSDNYNDELEQDMNPKIRLQICFDTVRTRSAKKNHSVQVKPIATTFSTTTSGYSSSICSSSSMINYIHDIQEKSFYLNDSTSQQYVSEENIYDKLSYNSSTQPCKCKSTASLINSSFNTSSEVLIGNGLHQEDHYQIK